MQRLLVHGHSNICANAYFHNKFYVPIFSQHSSNEGKSFHRQIIKILVQKLSSYLVASWQEEEYYQKINSNEAFVSDLLCFSYSWCYFIIMTLYKWHRNCFVYSKLFAATLLTVSDILLLIIIDITNIAWLQLEEQLRV